jgi:hypothetical protein
VTLSDAGRCLSLALSLFRRDAVWDFVIALLSTVRVAVFACWPAFLFYMPSVAGLEFVSTALLAAVRLSAWFEFAGS